MIKLRSFVAVRSRNASREQRHLEPERAQQSSESAVQFIAESAAPMGDDFIQNCRFVHRDFSAEMNIEILERHCHHMRAVECAQNLSMRFRGAGVMDTSKIRGSVDHGLYPDAPGSRVASIGRAPMRFDPGRMQQRLHHHAVLLRLLLQCAELIWCGVWSIEIKL